MITNFDPGTLSHPTDIAAGPGGNLFFVQSDQSIGRITLTGTITTYPTPRYPKALVAGFDGDIWFATDSNTVERMGTGVAAAPTGVVAAAGNGQVAISWAASALNGGPAITQYVVTTSPGGKTCTWTIGPLTCTITGLTNGTTYSFTVKGKNANGFTALTTPVNATPLRFSDVPVGAPFYADIDWLVDEGIASGYPDGTFKPTAPVTRQAMAAFLYRFSGSPLGPTPPCPTAPFKDVPVGAPFCGEIKWLVGELVTSGYPDGTYRPAEVVSRQAMAAFLYRIASRPLGVNPPCPSAPFKDVPVGAPFCGEITWLAGENIAGGYADGTYKPTVSVTRQAMAAFLHRLDGVLHPA